MRWSLVLLPLVLMACGEKDDTGEVDRIANILSLSADATAGGQTYATVCTSCHAADGSGGIGADLTVAVPEMSDEGIVTVILDGASGMAAYKDQFDDQEVADLLAYLRQEHGG